MFSEDNALGGVGIPVGPPRSADSGGSPGRLAGLPLPGALGRAARLLFGRAARLLFGCATAARVCDRRS
ncbi:hypothetical protein GCM10010269_08040 [Streptomyces humidus]|uniref:Uncharacterized protein n=1 Tax=Streptomyces humidus TaxID=52259 RepID=A0A918FRB1_9ACTN|nr:hypothetical protein GCM10010269_08040 [Streptomyces humidus]